MIPQERHWKILRRSHHCFSGAGVGTTLKLCQEVNQAGAKEPLQWETGTQSQSDAPGVSGDGRADFEQAQANGSNLSARQFAAV
jgi:hypothetical protein